MGKKINVVQNDNTVVLANLVKYSESELMLQNMRGQNLSVAISDIYEVIIDLND